MVQERPVRVERRLSAILAADVAGYSRLMHNDEEATHAKLSALHRFASNMASSDFSSTYMLGVRFVAFPSRPDTQVRAWMRSPRFRAKNVSTCTRSPAEAIHPAIAEHGGRIVKNTGDGFLAEFPSAVEAVRAALQFQNHIHELTTAEAEDGRITFRVGINIGDVIVEPHDIFGDGVNIAARLESIAEPGGICISSSAYDHVRGKVGVEFADLGEQSLKNIDCPVGAYALVRNEPSQVTRAERLRQNPLSPPHLSIVVLPFANFSGDAEQDYFVDGVTESLTTDLSRISDSFVIARNTAFTFKGKAVDVKRIGRELNVRYVLEGSVQRGDNRLRVNVQVVDAQNANHVWAERFDKPVADLFEMQDAIVSRLVNTLDAELIAVEARRAERSSHPDAMDLYFRGIACLHKGLTKEHLTQARDFFERALALDPQNVRALVGMANVDLTMGIDLFSDDRAASISAAEATLIKALSLAPRCAVAHMLLGTVHIFTARAPQGIVECEQALSLDRNLADSHGWIGLAKYFLGRAEETEARVSEALRLSPRDILAYRWRMIIGIAKIQLNADTEAVVWLRRSIEANRNFPLAHFHLAAALALVGSLDEARAAAQVGLALDPGFTIRRYQRHIVASDNPTFVAKREQIYQGMRLAGVPEG
jgi:TolB-like protein/class 3 adenylate cyclase/Tfp pilus assembly protein PilF